MSNKSLPILLGVIVIFAMLLGSCQNPQSTTTTSQPEKTSITTAITTSSTTTSAKQANWWDKFGQPKYGGTLNVPYGGYKGAGFDTFVMGSGDLNLFYDALFGKSWTVDRNQWAFGGMFTPDQYVVGNLVDTWEWTNPTTLTLLLHQGVKFQNKAPVNGRELTSADVVNHYNRIRGVAPYTQPSPMWGSMLTNWESVTAVDKYTVAIKFKQASAQNFQTIADISNVNYIEAPEWDALSGSSGSKDTDYNPLADWRTVVGTGPWILTDFVQDSTETFVKNPDYWGTDPRYPQNKVPYADKAVIYIISNTDTLTAAIRTGQVDLINASWLQAQNLRKTNPELQQVTIPMGSQGVNLVVDNPPFNDIRVRRAMDMAIDRKAIASGVYEGNANDYPSGMITKSYSGYAFAYQDWPQSLKDEYSYNPTESKKLLADAGFPNGFTTNVIAGPNNNMTELQAFKAYFHDIGVEMEIRTLDVATMGSVTRGGKTEQMAADNSAFTWPPTRLVGHFYSKSNDAVVYGLDNPPDQTYDTLYNKFITATDAADAAKIMQQMDRYYLEQHWQVMSTEYNSYIMWWPYLKGYSGEYFPSWGQQAFLSTIWLDK
jgi:peptide/nickel transport system substrate-binding protein